MQSKRGQNASRKQRGNIKVKSRFSGVESEVSIRGDSKEQKGEEWVSLTLE